MNHPALPVHRRPKVALLATGDELVMPGTAPGPGQIVYSNGYALRALARHEGADVIDLGIARDTVDDTAAAIRRAIEAGADILVTTGGASVGDHDRGASRRWKAKASSIGFWKIAMRPGKPMMHGRRGTLARARPARQSGLVLCLRDPVHGAADPGADRTQRRRLAAAGRRAGPRRARQRPARGLSARVPAGAARWPAGRRPP